jgi:hypothetical protein
VPDSRGRNVALGRARFRSSDLQTDRDSNQSAKDAIHSRCLSPQSRQLRRRDLRTDDGAHRLQGSRRSARLLALGRDVTLRRMVNLFVRDAQQLGSYCKRSNQPIGLNAVRATLRSDFPDDVTPCYTSFGTNF